MRTLLLCVVTSMSLIAGSVFADQRDPTGEFAPYQIDKSRSHNMIRSGEMTTEVGQYLPDLEEGPAYEVELYYKFNIQWVGLKEGTKLINVPAEYFTEQFIIDLRANGTYETTDFKIRHLGYGDAQNMDGNFYPNCDKILIYDVQARKPNPLVNDFSNALAGYYGLSNRADIEDIEITAHITYGIPVLGAVKIDMTAVYSGMNVFVGGDYEAR